MRTPALRLTVAIGALALAACNETTAPVVASDNPSLSREAAAAAKPGTATIVELAQGTSALSTLVFAIGYSDANCGTSFAATLGSVGGQYTVFAPTNAAFATLIGALGEATVLSCDVLPTVLAFHVTRGRHTSTSVLARQSIRMINGEWAAVEGTTIAGAPLNLGLVNISASNGIVHVVDAVLLPPSILAALQ
ncbi:MAG TPA: fasciclin domain-containing protein [Gemmatimonadaceae bacterium]|nr:fasciclin domain-containing protein [Gemmatimonadaceae bacterium]